MNGGVARIFLGFRLHPEWDGRKQHHADLEQILMRARTPEDRFRKNEAFPERPLTRFRWETLPAGGGGSERRASPRANPVHDWTESLAAKGADSLGRGPD